jgi:hypothetical protein
MSDTVSIQLDICLEHHEFNASVLMFATYKYRRRGVRGRIEIVVIEKPFQQSLKRCTKMYVTLIVTLRTSPSMYETHFMRTDLKIYVKNHVIRAFTLYAYSYAVCIIQ